MRGTPGKRRGNGRGYLRPRVFAEGLEGRFLLSSSIQLLNTTYEFEAGQPFTVLGRLLNDSGQPVGGVNITADDSLLDLTRSLGTTTPQGYFSLDYTAAQTTSVGAGLYMVRINAADVQ